jgi:periplasmic protein TonB
MTQAVAVYRIYELPWATSAEQERRFRRLLAAIVAGALVLAIILSALPLPEQDPAETVEIPQRYARLVLEREAPPPPPIIREEPEPAVEEPAPAPVPAVEEPAPVPVVEERPEPLPAPEPAPAPAEPERVVNRAEQARERASVAGLLPFASQLATLRDNENLDSLDRAGLSGGVAGEAPTAERSLITSRVGTGSGGIDTAALSRNTGGAGLAVRATTQVDSPVAGFGPAGGAAERSDESDRASRSREEVERVFDANKGAIHTLYNRALRQNPALEGKVVLRLTISPEGTVTFCEIVSSELGDPDLEAKLIQRVLLFKFESKDVEPVTTTKPIDFFPA